MQKLNNRVSTMFTEPKAVALEFEALTLFILKLVAKLQKCNLISFD